MKRLLQFIALFLFPVASWGQFTQVTATVPQLVNATYIADFIGLNTTPGAGPYLLAGISAFPQQLTGSFTSSGVMNLSLADNNQVLPLPSQWRFNICQVVSPPPSPICFNIQLTITGTSQNISSQITAALPPLPTPGNPVLLSPLVTQTIVQPINTDFSVNTSGGGKQRYNGNEVLTTASGIPSGNAVLYSPTLTQTVTQPINTNFNFITSGSGTVTHNSHAILDVTTGVQIAPAATQNVTQPGGTSLNVNSLNNMLNAALYCTTPGTLDNTCLENAAAIASGRTIYMPAGTYTGGDSNVNYSNLHIKIDPDATLNYNLLMSGSGFVRSNTVISTGSYAAATTTFSGNFSAFSNGQTVVIEQVDNNGTIPIDFATVSSASGTQLVITTGTRFAYLNPHISVVTDTVKFSGTIPNGAQTITGNFTSSFSAGDIIRVENTTGTDDPASDTNYFELVRVAAINTSAITLETGTHASYGNPWLAKMVMLSNVTISGSGYVQKLQIQNARQVTVNDVFTNVLIAQWLYDMQFLNLRGATTVPSAYFFTFLWNGVVSNINAYGAVGTTDNGNVKFLGIQGVAISGISTWQGTDTVQGEYPFMVDFNFAPYSLWNAGDTMSSISAGSTLGVSMASVFLSGFRNSSGSAISNNGNVTILASSGLSINGMTTPGQILIQTGNGYQFSNFSADSMAIGQIAPVNNSIFEHFTIAGGATENGGAAINVLGGSNNRFLHGEFTQSNLTFYTLNVQATSSNMYYEDLQDYAGTNLVFSLHTNGTGTHMLAGNRFASTIQGPFNTYNIPVLTINNLGGTGNALACLTSTGQVYRGTATTCP